MEVESGRETFFFKLALCLTYPHPTHVSLKVFIVFILIYYGMRLRQRPCEIGKQKMILKYTYSLSQFPEEWEASLCSGGTIEELCAAEALFYHVAIVALPPQQGQGCRAPLPLSYCIPAASSIQNVKLAVPECIWELCCPLHALLCWALKTRNVTSSEAFRILSVFLERHWKGRNKFLDS